MKILTQRDALHIIGIELRTRNLDAARTIPPFWQRVHADRVLEQLSGRLSGDVYAVYTHFEHAGVNNEGLYSLVIGAAMPAQAEVPPGMVRVVAPAGRRAVFEVAPARPDRVGAAWARIWEHSELPKSYVADYERYGPDGQIDIWIGLHPAGA